MVAPSVFRSLETRPSTRSPARISKRESVPANSVRDRFEGRATSMIFTFGADARWQLSL
jgi:hypothetical protein